MKKNILALCIAFGAFSTVALAADDAGTAIPGNGLVQTGDCSLLTEDVTLNLSQNVFGAYACNTTDSVIAVATCHPTGRKGNILVPCDPVANPAATPAYVPPAGCAIKANPANVNDGEMTVKGGLTFTANTGGGTVQGTSALNCKTGGNTTAEAAAASGL